jgi:serine/threonine-protein kinase
MSEVYAATDLRLGRPVAVKVLAAHLDEPRGRHRFEREAQTLSSFVHPNAITIFDAGIHGERPYLVMELVDGPTLSQHLLDHGPLPADEATGVAQQVLAALDAAHRRGIVHRDVKPSNILLGSLDPASSGGPGSVGRRVRLADFGIAKSMSDLTADLTATGQVVGTASYLAPEVARGAPATPASDVYSVGVVVFEMLTGEVPLRGPTPVATLVRRERSAAPRLRSVCADVPVALDVAVARALSRDPRARYPTAHAMRVALTDPARAPADTPTDRLTAAPLPARPKRGGRRRWLVPVVVATALVAGGYVAFGALHGDGGARAGRDTPATTVAVATTAPTLTVPPTTTPSSIPASAAPPQRARARHIPHNISELAALLATPGARYGIQQQALRARLLALAASNHGQFPKQAAALARDVQRWAATGQLDPAIANEAVQVLGGAGSKRAFDPNRR